MMLAFELYEEVRATCSLTETAQLLSLHTGIIL